MKFCASPEPRKSGIAICGTWPPDMTPLICAGTSYQRPKRPKMIAAIQKRRFMIRLARSSFEFEPQFDIRLVAVELRRERREVSGVHYGALGRNVHRQNAARLRHFNRILRHGAVFHN